jgi:hypothetical protein
MATTLNSSTLAFEEYVQVEDPLPSWNEGSAKQSIVVFVRGVTTAGDSHFVKAEDRIAVFDNDGTLWSEQPLPFQFAFVIDRLKATASQHPRRRYRGGGVRNLVDYPSVNPTQDVPKEGAGET